MHAVGAGFNKSVFSVRYNKISDFTLFTHGNSRNSNHLLALSSDIIRNFKHIINKLFTGILMIFSRIDVCKKTQLCDIGSYYISLFNHLFNSIKKTVRKIHISFSVIPKHRIYENVGTLCLKSLYKLKCTVCLCLIQHKSRYNAVKSCLLLLIICHILRNNSRKVFTVI